MNKVKIFVETQRLVLRQWKPGDCEPFIELNQDRNVMEFFPSLKTREETIVQIEKISAHINRCGYGFFAVERKDNNQVIGFTGLTHPGFESYFTPCVEIGWRLSKANWNMGFATEAAKACLAYGFDSLLLKEIYSFTSIHNKRSARVMEKIGMIKQGEFDHPLIKEGDFLKKHVLYRSDKTHHIG